MNFFQLRLGPPKGDSALQIDFFAELESKDGLELRLGLSLIKLKSFSLDADISPGGEFGTLRASASFDFGKKAGGMLAVSISENPEADGFAAEIKDATLEDIFQFALEMVGFSAQNLHFKLLREIEICELFVEFAPAGMTIAGTVYPAGFFLSASIFVAGQDEVEAKVAITKTSLEIMCVLAPLKLRGLGFFFLERDRCRVGTDHLR